MPYIQEWIESSFIRETLKAHRITSETPTVTGNFVDCSGFTVIDAESSGDAVTMNADNKTIEISRDGIYSLSGCFHFQNNSGSNISLQVGLRLVKNPGTEDVEMKCSQRYVGFDQQDGGENNLEYNATDYLEAGDTVRLQYYVNSTDVEFYSSNIFDNPVAYTLIANWEGVKS